MGRADLTIKWLPLPSPHFYVTWILTAYIWSPSPSPPLLALAFSCFFSFFCFFSFGCHWKNNEIQNVRIHIQTMCKQKYSVKVHKCDYTALYSSTPNIWWSRDNMVSPPVCDIKLWTHSSSQFFEGKLWRNGLNSHLWCNNRSQAMETWLYQI